MQRPQQFIQIPKTFKTPYQVFFERTGIDARQLGVVRL
jgi:hypothetical protein